MGEVIHEGRKQDGIEPAPQLSRWLAESTLTRQLSAPQQRSLASTPAEFGDLLLIGDISAASVRALHRGGGGRGSEDTSVAAAYAEKEPPAVRSVERPAAVRDSADTKLEAGKLFDRSRVDKIVRIREVKSGASTREVREEVNLKPGEKLPPGSYEVIFKQTPYEKEQKRPGRAFRIHIPVGAEKDAPVMVVMPGASSSFQNPRGYVKEVHMEETADKAKKKFIVVTPLTEKHSIDGKSKTEAWAWNYPNSLIPNDLVRAHEKKVGYNDGDYLSGVMNLTSELSAGTSDHRRWGWMGGSQGAAFLHSLACSDPRFKGKMHNIYVAGGSIPDREGEPKFIPQDGNGMRVINIDTAADKQVLPRRWQPDRFRDMLAKAAGLDAVDNKNQNPDKQEMTYLRTGDKQVKVFRRLGDSDEYSVRAYVAKDNDAKFKTSADFNQELTSQEALEKARKASKDIKWVYLVKKLGVKIDAYELPKAEHIIPGPREGSTSFQKNKKYEGIFSAKIFADDLLEQDRRFSK